MAPALLFLLLAGSAEAAHPPAQLSLASAFNLEDDGLQPKTARMQRLRPRSSQPQSVRESDRKAPETTTDRVTTKGRNIQRVAVGVLGTYVVFVGTGLLIAHLRGNDDNVNMGFALGLVGAIAVVPISATLFVIGTILDLHAKSRQVAVVSAPVDGGRGIALNVRF